MWHNLRQAVAENILQVYHYVVDHVDTFLDGFCLSYVLSMYLHAWFNISIPSLLGINDVVHCIYGGVTLIWISFRALEAFEGWRIKRRERKNKETEIS